ncbi:hypothetical protein TNCV_3929151 [Trichonephila clavipes]|nr:hypothetical protein TNCV_3929151 [Trichonephila clavipes]
MLFVCKIGRIELMFDKNAFYKTKKALSTAPEFGRVIGLREGGFSFHDIAERLETNVFTVHDCWKQWSSEGSVSRRHWFSGSHVALLREANRIRHTAVVHHT